MQPRTERIRGSALQKLRRQVAAEQPLCPDCEAQGRVTAWYEQGGELDHVKPLHKGGTNERSNLEGVCKLHHDERTAREQGHRRRVKVGADGWPVRA